MHGVTISGILPMMGALAFCALQFVAILGYGAAVLRTGGWRRPGLTQSAATGFGAATLLGGILNAMHLVMPPVLLGFSLVGIVLAGVFAVPSLATAREEFGLAEPARERGNSAKIAGVILLCFALVLGLRLMASFHTAYYQAEDDYAYQLAVPEKMLVEHHLPADAFSERRIQTSTGGYEFFNVLVMSVLPVEDVQMADRVFGLLLTAMLAFALARAFGLTATQRALFALFLISMTQLQFNLSFVILPSALFFALVLVAVTPQLRARPWLEALVLGMLTAAIGGLKSTYIVHAVIFCVLLSLYRARRENAAAGVRLFVGSAAACFVVLLPWMLVNRAEVGTMFFPLLGSGYHFHGYHQFLEAKGPSFTVVVKKVLPFNAPLFVIFLAEYFFGDREDVSRTATLLCLTAAIASDFVGLATGGDSVRRYNYPCILPAFLLAFPVFCHRANALRKLAAGQAEKVRFASMIQWLPAAGALLSAGLVFYIGLNSWTHEFAGIRRDLRAGLRNDAVAVPSGTRQEYAALNQALPRDAAALITTDDNFLMDFRTHHLYIADFPATAGPPPGWPVKGTGQDLAGYLLGHHIRYLVYSYGTEAGIPQSLIDHQLSDPGTSKMIVSEAMAANVGHRQYAELAKTRRHIFDDGRIYVLDLSAPAGSQVVVQLPGLS